MTICYAGKGDTIKLWSDKWCSHTISQLMPQLFSYAKKADTTLASVSNMEDSEFYELFHLPMSFIAVQQSTNLRELINNRENQQLSDSWKFYSGDTKYSNKRIYLELMGNPVDAPKPYQWIWKSCSLPKHKLFFWLLLQDILNTRDLLNMKNFYIETSKCELCDDEPNEHLMHLFFSCDFSQIFWMNIGNQWNTDHNLMDILLEGRKQDTHGCFKECLIAGCWSL